MLNKLVKLDVIYFVVVLFFIFFTFIEKMGIDLLYLCMISIYYVRLKKHNKKIR